MAEFVSQGMKEEGMITKRVIKTIKAALIGRLKNIDTSAHR